VESLTMNLVHRRWQWVLHTSHDTPCLKMPHRSEPQWSQKVGRLNVFSLKRCGMSMLKRCCSCSLRVRIVCPKSSAPGHFAMTFSWQALCTTWAHSARWVGSDVISVVQLCLCGCGSACN